MTPVTAFRVSTYLTVAVACAALGYAEADLFPEVGAFTVAILVALAVIYRLETRVRLLSLADANKLATGIVVAGVLWGGYRLVREYRAGEFATFGWPTFFVMLTAPVLMASVAAKLLRREKHAGDYWFLHAAALGSVVLAAAVAERLPSLLLLAGYAVCAVWSLYHFFTARANGSVPPIPTRRPTAAPAVPSGVISAGTPWGRFGLAGTLLVATAAGAVAIPLYLLTPRSGFDKLELGQPRVEIGYAADQMIDLNHTGELAVNPAPAFAVWATEGDGRPKEDLNPDQRWRGAALAAYDKGVWRRTVEVEFPEVAAMAARVSAWSPPDLGPGRYRLTFSVPTRLTGQFLADPVSWAAGQPSPVVELGPGGPQRPWYPRPDGSFLRTERSSRQGQAHYAQFRSPAQDSDLGPGFELRREGSRILTTNPIPRVKEYADAVLAELVREGRLPPAARALNAVRLLPADEYHEAIARAFTEYLAGRAGLAYTTDLPPVPKGMDPIEHFLFHSRAGHCERFAAALCFMLRSQGIPAAVVLGFKGCDHLGGGRYEVRQEHAHAWVEALISRPADPAPGRVWHWLSLDPTPTQGASGGGIGAGGPDSWFDRGRTAFNRYVLHYTEKDREQTLHDAADWLTSPALSGTVGGLVLLGVGAIVWRRRAAAPPSPPVTESGRWIDRLLALLAAHGFAIRPGETVREFATGTAQALHARGVPAALAGVPVEWAAAYYTTRFGGTPIPPDRLAELEDGLAALRRALADHPGGGS